MNEKRFKLGVIVGRFQSLHLGHEDMINTALSLSERVAVFVGSSQEFGTAKNPFTFEMRKQLLFKIYGDRVEVYPLPDIGVGNNSSWGDYVIKTVMDCCGSYPDLVVSGRESRRNSWYDNYEVAELFIPKTVDISASQIREFFINDDYEEWKSFTNPKIWDEYKKLREIILSSMNNLETNSI